jgi:ABC-2 type transport system ATP-binding protein
MLFLDEPTAGIDPLLRTRIWDELHRLRDEGRTLLVTTQYVNEAEACDSVALIADGRLIALATPDELRRLAVGGDIIEIETAAPFDGGTLSALPAVREVDQPDPTHVRVTVDEASTALPDVVEAIGAHGAEVRSASEARPSFDTVFATLVERQRDADAAAAAAAETSHDDGAAA